MAKKFVSELEYACGSREGDIVEDYNPKIRHALNQINICQYELDNLNKKAAQEIINVERKYNRVRKVYLVKRNNLGKTVPKFWATVFSNHPLISTILETEELECLNYLTKLEVEENDDICSGYKISFYFEENPYFENDVVTKQFHFGTEYGSYSLNTPIIWKVGNELLKKQRPTERRKRCLDPKYFFSWFEDHTDPTADVIAEYHGYSVITSEESDAKEEIEVLGDEEEEEEELVEEEQLEVAEEDDVVTYPMLPVTSEYHGYSVITSEEALEGKIEIGLLEDEEEEEEEEEQEESEEEDDDVAIIWDSSIDAN